MPGAKGEGRPATRTFMKLGRVSVTRPDSLNWAVEHGDTDKTTYHVTLPRAIQKAVEAAAESRSRDAQEWLAEYKEITAKLEVTLHRALRNWTAEGPGAGD